MSILRDYRELENDKKLIEVVENFDNCLNKIEISLLAAVQFDCEGQLLTTQDKVKLDNYMIYCINSLFWMHLKLQGDDPNEHGIKNELSRVRQTILRDKQIYEHDTIRPVVDKSVAERFIKRGLHIHDRPVTTHEDSRMEE
uniref:Nuclear nucleic acid-binding protein C1D n=1 Tax=Glossina brevipalpis TaxID=37001 RepID=A0A1A9W345_9MUSC